MCLRILPFPWLSPNAESAKGIWLIPGVSQNRRFLISFIGIAGPLLIWLRLRKFSDVS